MTAVSQLLPPPNENHAPGPDDRREPASAPRNATARPLPDGEVDARAMIDAHPDLRGCSQAYLDLVLDQYQVAKKSGRNVDPFEFAEQFQTHFQTLAVLFLADDLAADAAPEIDWPKPGETFLDFHLVQQIAEGAASRVFHAKEPNVASRDVIVKVCSNEIREADIVGLLEHPNIAKINTVRYDEERRLSAICMPFEGVRTLVCDIAGPEAETGDDEQLDDVARESRLDDCVRYAAHIAAALKHAHEKRTVHGDIKPANVLIANGNVAKLIDFNAGAKERNGNEEVFAKRLEGTLEYMAPEQLRSSIDESTDTERTPESDVFAFGRTFHHVIHGRLPDGRTRSLPLHFTAEQELAYRASHARTSHAEPLPQRFREFETTLAECLHDDPARRPTAAELAGRLEAMLSPEPQPQSSPSKPIAWVAPALAVVAAVLAVAAWWTGPGGSAGTEHTEAKPGDDSESFDSVGGAKTPANPMLEALLRKYANLQKKIKDSKDPLDYVRLGGVCDGLAEQSPDKASKVTRWNEAIACFRNAMQLDARLQGPMFENIGYCRIRIYETRSKPVQTLREDGVNVKALIGELRTTVADFVNDKAELDLALVNRCLKIAHGNCQTHLLIAILFRQADLKRLNPNRKPGFRTRALEHCWVAVAMHKPKDKFMGVFWLKQLAGVHKMAEIPEFLHLQQRGFKRPKLIDAALIPQNDKIVRGDP